MICKGSSAFRLKNMGFLHNTVETLIFKLFLIRDRYKPLSFLSFFFVVVIPKNLKQIYSFLYLHYVQLF